MSNDQVRHVVHRAGRRFLLNDFLQAFALTLACAMVLVLIVRVVERVFSFEDVFTPYWKRIMVGAGAAALLGALGWTFYSRRKVMDVAVQVDERAGLKESLSTALYLEKETDPWSSAVRDTARTAAASVNVSRAVPLETPRAWPIPIGAGIALLVVWWAVPSMDLLGTHAQRTEQKERSEQVMQVRTQVDQDKQKIKEILDRRANQFLDEKPDDAGVPEQKIVENDPDAIRKAAIRDLTQLQDRLEAARQDEKAMQSEALKQAMEQLRQPGPGPLDQMTRQLAKGDFAGAKAALEQVEKQLSSGNMSPEQKQQLKDQLGNLSRQLDNLSKKQDELEKKLQQQGLDKKTAQELAKKAADPAALKEALEKLPQLSQAQKDALMQMAKSACEAGKQCSNMSQAMSKMAQGMSQQGLQQEGMEGLDQLNQELSEMEMMQSDMDSLNAALDETNKQLAKLGQQCKGGGKGDGQGECEGDGMLGKWREGEANKRGKGSGGPGKGDGRSPDAEATDFTWEKTKSQVQTRQGSIIGSRLVFGEQIKGEARAEFAEVINQAEASAAEGIDSMRIPREMEGAVKAYFGRLKEKAEKSPSQPAATAPSTDAKDAGSK